MSKSIFSNVFGNSTKEKPQTRRESKPNSGYTYSPIQIDPPLKDVNLYLNLPPNYYKFMLEIDPTLQDKFERIISFLGDRIKYPYPPEILEELKDASKLFKRTFQACQEQAQEIEELKQQNTHLIQSLMSKEQIIQQVESSYITHFEQVKERTEEQTKSLRDEILTLQEKNSALMTSAQQLEQEKQTLLENIEVAKREQYILKFQLNEATQKIAELKEEIEVLKDTRTGSLIINNVFQKIVGVPQTKDPHFYYLLTGKFRNQFLRFFDPQDLLNLMLSSRKLYFLVRNNKIMMTHVINCKTKNLQTQLNDALQDANYFTEAAEKIPEEILQQGIAKFLAFRFQAGSYFNDIFKDIWDFIEGRLESPGSSAPNSIPQSPQPTQNFQEMFKQDEVETTDLIGLDDDRKIVEPVQQQMPQEKSSGFFSKIKNLTSNKSAPQQAPQPAQQSMSLSQLSQQLQQELQSIGQVCANALQLPFLRSQLQQYRQDSLELKQRVQQLNGELFILGQKCVQPGSKVGIQEFMKRLHYNFARMLTYSHYLRLECQQLQHTTHFLAQSVLKLNKQITSNNVLIEDLQEECKTLKAMNQFMQGRTKQMEERVHQGEEDLLQMNLERKDLQESLSQYQQQISDMQAQNKEKDQKLKVLAVSLKQSLNEKQQLQKNLNTIVQHFSGLKAMLPGLL